MAIAVLVFTWTDARVVTSYDSDGEVRIDLVSNTAKDDEKSKQRDVSKAIALEKRLSTAEGKCAVCFKNSGFKKHLMVALGEFTYLALPLVRPCISEPALSLCHLPVLCRRQSL